MYHKGGTKLPYLESQQRNMEKVAIYDYTKAS